MARKLGDTGQAAVLDASQIKRLIKIAQTTNHSHRDQTVVVLSYWLGLRAKELASLKIGDVYLSCDEAPKVGTGFGTIRRTNDQWGIKQVLHLKSTYTKRTRTRDVIQKRLREYWDGNPPAKPLG